MALALAALLALPAPLQAQPAGRGVPARREEGPATDQERSVALGPATLAGRWAEAVFAVDLPGQASTLTLDLSASELLWLRQSVVTVELDEAPLYSGRLAGLLDQERRGQLTLPLPAVTAGYHRLGLHAQLQIEGDPCLDQLEREAWLRLGPDSAIRWQGPALDEAEEGLAALPARWRELEAVALLDPQVATPKVSAAWLQAEHLLRDWGLTPYDPADTDAIQDDDEGATLELLLAPQAEDDISATLRWEERRLTVEAADGDGLLAGVRALADPQLRDRCRRSPCLIGPEWRADASQAANDSEAGALRLFGALVEDDEPGSEPAAQESDEAERQEDVLTLAEAIGPRGWTARGPGTHRIQLVQPVDPRWELRPFPELELLAAHSQAAGLDTERSRLTISLGGEPLGSWRLDRLGHNNRVVVRVPESAWSEPQWVFTVEVALREEEGRACSPVDAAGLWLRLDPDSRLRVPRHEREPVGLAGVHERAAGGRPLLVLEGRPDAALLRDAAAALYPLHRRDPEGVWRWATGGDLLDCVETVALRRRPREGRALPVLVEAEGDRYWRGADHEDGLPLLPAEGTALLALREAEGCPRVELSVPHEPAPVAPWGALDGNAAFYDGADWALLGPPLATRSVLVASSQDVDQPAVISEQARWLRIFDAGFLALVLATLIVAGLVLLRSTPAARRRRARYDDGWLPDNPEHAAASTHPRGALR